MLTMARDPHPMWIGSATDSIDSNLLKFHGAATKLRPRGHSRLERLWSVVEFDQRTPRIGNEADPGTGLFILGVGAFDLHALCLQVLAERLQILHVEADVIEHMALRADGRHIGLGEGE